MRRIALVVALGMTLELLVAHAPAAEEPVSYPVFIGGLHTHTGYSDGMPDTTPADAYARARDVEKLDFLAVTEHSETLPTFSTFSDKCLPTEGGTIVECALIGDEGDPPDVNGPVKALNKWDAQRKMAVAETKLEPKPFLALRGFEWSSDVFGHMNVYFSRNYTSWMADGGAAAMETFYQWLQTPAALGGGADGLATFNHPGAKTMCKQGLEDVPGTEEFCASNPLDNWNHFAPVSALDDHIVGIEIYNRTRNYEPYVVEALDKGWHLGMIGAEDIHELDWGAARYAKTAFLAPRLTLSDLKEAMRARRTYATLDKAIRINFTADGRPMGSRIPGSTADLVVEVDGGDSARIELITNGGNLVASANRPSPEDGPRLEEHVAVSGAEQWFMVRVLSSTGQAVAYSSPVWVGSLAPAPFSPHWVAGDLHVHTTYSHDSWEGPDDDNTTTPDETYTYGWTPGQQITIAESRGLDYVALTDHNDVRSGYDPGFTSDRLTLIPSYENSLAGHAQMINTPYCLTPEGPTASFIDCNDFDDRDIPARIQALADDIRARGGSFQINHPSDGEWIEKFGDGTRPNGIVPDSIEVWNIGPWHWQHPAPASNDNDFSLKFWETYLRAGEHVAATGGSDNHWRSTTAAQGVGQPTTWVYVTRPGAEGIVEGVRAGRTTISALPPAYGGARIYLEADEDRDGTFEAMAGDTVALGSRFRWRLENAPPNSQVNIVWSGNSYTPRTAPATFEFEVRVDTPLWVRLELVTPDLRAERQSDCEPTLSAILANPIVAAVLDLLTLGNDVTYCRNRLLVHALTSAMYID
jgi:hypothetical protein